MVQLSGVLGSLLLLLLLPLSSGCRKAAKLPTVLLLLLLLLQAYFWPARLAVLLGVLQRPGMLAVRARRALAVLLAGV
jgi:hypothetical protein